MKPFSLLITSLFMAAAALAQTPEKAKSAGAGAASSPEKKDAPQLSRGAQCG